MCSRISGCADFGHNVDGIGNETQFIVEGPGKYGFRTSGCATFGSNVYGVGWSRRGNIIFNRGSGEIWELYSFRTSGCILTLALVVSIELIILSDKYVRIWYLLD